MTSPVTITYVDTYYCILFDTAACRVSHVARETPLVSCACSCQGKRFPREFLCCFFLGRAKPSWSDASTGMHLMVRNRRFRPVLMFVFRYIVVCCPVSSQSRRISSFFKRIQISIKNNSRVSSTQRINMQLLIVVIFVVYFHPWYCHVHTHPSRPGLDITLLVLLLCLVSLCKDRREIHMV